MHDPESGPAIHNCNGRNVGHCSTADEVNKKRLRRPNKRAAEGDPDWTAQESKDKATPIIHNSFRDIRAQKYSSDLSTGAPIPICNGANTGNCTEADEVVKHRLRRPFKAPAVGDPDHPDTKKAAAYAQVEKQDLSSGPPIPICNGANIGNCTEADVVVVNAIRRPHKRAAAGDSDFPAQEAADAARVASLAQVTLWTTDPSTGDNPGGTTLGDGSIDQGVDANDEVAVFTVTLPSNGETAIIDGIEFAIQHTFGETGFGALFNATLVDSDSDLDVADITQKFAVTGLSDSMNLVGYYEDGPYQVRLAYNYRAEFLQSLTQNNGDGVTFVDNYAQWDMSGSVDFQENISVFLEITNLSAG